MSWSDVGFAAAIGFTLGSVTWSLIYELAQRKTIQREHQLEDYNQRLRAEVHELREDRDQAGQSFCKESTRADRAEKRLEKLRTFALELKMSCEKILDETKG